MNIRRLALPFIALFVGFCQPLAAADKAKAATKPGYNVVIEVTFNEQGVGEEAKVVETDDMSGDMILNSIAMHLVASLKEPPKLVDGKPVKFTARVPFNFPVEGDEGAVANDAPKPAIHTAQQPTFPESMAAKGEDGGAILELVIGTFGNVESVKVLRSSHQDYADAAVAAVKNWVFAPARKDGVPVECRWRIAVAFSADGKEVDWKWRVAPRPSLGGYTVVRPKLPPVPAPASATAPAAAPVPAPSK